MAGKDAFATQLERSDNGDTFTAIANVTSFSGPEMERDTYDTTAHDSPNQYREFVGGLINAGEFSIEVNYDPADHDTLVEDFEDDVARGYRLTFPGGAMWEFQAWLTGFAAEAPVDDKLSAELTFQLTGKPTITPAGTT